MQNGVGRRRVDTSSKSQVLKNCVQRKELISVLREKLQQSLGEKFIDVTNFHFNLRSSRKPLPVPRSPAFSAALIKASEYKWLHEEWLQYLWSYFK